MNQNQGKISIPGLIEKVSKMSGKINCTGISGACMAYMIARLFMELGQTIVVIVPSLKDADRIIEDLNFFLKENALIDTILLLFINRLVIKMIANTINVKKIINPIDPVLIKVVGIVLLQRDIG